MTTELFRACDGFEFRSGGHTFTLQVGRYANDRGAIQIFDVAEGPECTLTHNIDAPLRPGEFFVRFEVMEHSRAPRALLDLGVFEDTGRVVEQGFVERYAAVWRFAPCREVSHHHSAEAIMCEQCRDAIRAGQ